MIFWHVIVILYNIQYTMPLDNINYEQTRQLFNNTAYAATSGGTFEYSYLFIYYLLLSTQCKENNSSVHS